ncbi:MAG TPA: hypothetical protein VG738_06140 [Chitinophagaceae bacterium]|nr:hypothetical protein [Chitinophagaceae bacterium]
MDAIIFDDDVTVLYVTATSFPAGIMQAFAQLREKVQGMEGRKLFGLSRPENGMITYHAATEEKFESEGKQLHCDTLVLKKGKYICHTVNNFMNNLPAIGNTFRELLAQPGIDPQGYCVEWYFNDTDVHCMVRLAE